MKTISKIGLGLAGALALVLTQVAPAHADVAAQADDIVGVGSDTVQFGVTFLADGDVNGNTGFNNANLSRRIISFDSSGDANGGATTNATSVLRANTLPRTRPNGSGAGITALNTDTGSTEVINFVRSSRLPTPAEQTTATNNGWGGLHVYQFATDGLRMAASNSVTSNAPAALTISDLVNIYQGTFTTWGQVPGYSGPAPTATIKPYIPQAGSGTRNFFLADLQAANGGTAITLAASVLAMQEHDPTLIKNDPNAIGPFSVGRANLFTSGYFGAANTSLIKLLAGTNSYNTTRGLYLVEREKDVNSPTPWQVGSTKNWVKTLFSGATSWVARSSNAPLIASAGVTPAYSDLGIVSG
jgi:ABC-type phosphate transport system substrate-binding protein